MRSKSTYSQGKQLILSNLLSKGRSELLDLFFAVLLALGEVLDRPLVLRFQFLVALVPRLLLLPSQLLFHPTLAVFQRQIDRYQGQIVEKFISLLMCDEIFELGVNYAPERPLLHCAFGMFTVEKSNVEHLFRIISAISKQLFVLEVRELNVAMLLELLRVDMCLSDRRTPAIIRQIHRIAKPFHASLKDFKFDALNVKLLFHIGDKMFRLAVCDDFRGAWTHVIRSFAQVAPKVRNILSIRWKN